MDETFLIDFLYFFPNDTLLLVTTTFVLAGFVKGVIGLGFPTIVIGVLAVILGLHEAMVLMVLPSLFTNLWQAAFGGHFKVLIKRFWPLFIIAIGMTWFTTGLLQRVEGAWLLCLLGLILCLYSLLGLSTPSLPSIQRSEVWMTPVVGCINGVLTGLTGTFVVPGVLYFQSLNLEKDNLIQAMGLLFLLSTVALGGGLLGNKLFNAQLGLLSAAAVLPSFAGMMFGQWVRRYLTEIHFKRLFYLALMLLGIYILVRSLPL